jgi:monofunctional biosynthetic peptidoglycan transglycosylase
MKAKGALQVIKKVIIYFFVGQLVYIILLKWIDPPVTMPQIISWFNGDGLKRDYINQQEMSKYAGLAVMAAEDQTFPAHNGFDWKSIEKAMDHNKKKPKKIRGASTISQQVAKNVFLWPGRSWVRKGLEVYFTFMIEVIWGKKRILEVYLNVAEMGKGVYGIEAAAQQDFKKHAKNLTLKEASMIAARLPNPKKYTIKPISQYVIRRSAWIMKQMYNLQQDPEIKNILTP